MQEAQHAHSFKPDAAAGVHAFRCADCGAVQTRPPSEPPRKTPPRLGQRSTDRLSRAWIDKGGKW